MQSETSSDQDPSAAADWLLEAYQRLPALVGALAIVFLGWLLARAARSGASWLASNINRVLERNLRSGNLASARLPSSAVAVIGEICFWAVMVLALTIAAQLLGLPLFDRWLDAAVAHVPNLLVGVLIIVIGWALASRIGGSEGSASVARRLTQALILALALVIGFEQFGLDMKLPVVLLGVVVGAGFLAFAIAFGLGAREYVSAGIASRVLTGQLHRGMRVRIGAHEGDVIEINGTHLLLDTEDGQLLVPLSDALGEQILILRPEGGSADVH
ncbi:MAG: hypothetical protein KDI37_07075 [Xanthomonadales bacterium]|nr:hypothetical protein [Xanthomonadales bacterium]